MTSAPQDPQVSQKADLPTKTVTVNQLVGYNMAFFRQKAGLTQEELGRRLGGWTKVAVSAAERSWDGKRIRKFDADEIIAIAGALEIPAVALLLPPPDAETAIGYTFAPGPASPPIDSAHLVEHLVPFYGKAPSPALAAVRERVMTLGASALFLPPSEEVLNRARQEADYILIKARDHAYKFTGDAVARAESLEQDARDRHRQAMGTLIQSREELERRVDDLRAFEREYRIRLLEYLEGQIQDLKAGAADSGVFPPLTTGLNSTMPVDLPQAQAPPVTPTQI